MATRAFIITQSKHNYAWCFWNYHMSREPMRSFKRQSMLHASNPETRIISPLELLPLRSRDWSGLSQYPAVFPRIFSSTMRVDPAVVVRHATKGKRRKRSTILWRNQCFHSFQHHPKKDIPCPTITPQISSLGTLPCSIKLKPMRTHGKYGAVKTKRPKKLSLVSGFLLDQMYTRELLRAEPRNGMESMGLRHSRIEVA